MKIAGFLVLCIVATTLATPLLTTSRTRRQSDECDTPEGLTGVLQQLGNLVGNLLDNIGRLNLASILTGNQGVLHLVSDLLNQVARILNDLLGSNVTDNDANESRGLLVNLLQNIKDLLNDLLGDESGTKWACNSSNGLIGSLISNTIASLGNLTGSFNNDQSLLAGLLKMILQTVSSVSTLMV